MELQKFLLHMLEKQTLNKPLQQSVNADALFREAIEIRSAKVRCLRRVPLEERVVSIFKVSVLNDVPSQLEEDSFIACRSDIGALCSGAR